MEMIDDSSYITSHRVWRSDIFQSHIGMQTERLLCDPSNWSDLLKTTFSNYTNILCSWLVICNIFIARGRGWVILLNSILPILPAALSAKWLLGRWYFQSGCELSWGEASLSLVLVVQMKIFLTQTSWLCLTEQSIHQYLWEILWNCDVMWAEESYADMCHGVSCRSTSAENITTFFLSCWAPVLPHTVSLSLSLISVTTVITISTISTIHKW